MAGSGGRGGKHPFRGRRPAAPVHARQRAVRRRQSVCALRREGRGVGIAPSRRGVRDAQLATTTAAAASAAAAAGAVTRGVSGEPAAPRTPWRRRRRRTAVPVHAAKRMSGDHRRRAATDTASATAATTTTPPPIPLPRRPLVGAAAVARRAGR